MGCTQSKFEDEEAVNRCKDRKRFMKDAVAARSAFAAAHSSHSMSLKNTGAALSDYAHGEVQPTHHLPLSSSAADGALPSSSSASKAGYLPPPPPPLPPPAPLHRATSMPEISVHKPDPKRADPIIEDGEEGEVESGSPGLKHRVSRSSGGGGSRGGGVSEELPPRPPSPPRTSRVVVQPPPPPPPPDTNGMSNWDFFFPAMENVPGPSLAAVDEVDESTFKREEMERKLNEEQRLKREEMERKLDEEQWFKREEMERKLNDEQRAMRERADAVFDGGDGGGGRRKSGRVEAAEVVESADDQVELPPPQLPLPMKAVKKVKPPSSTESKRGGKGVSNVSLVKIFSDLDDCFLRASQSAHDVSKMLEAHRLHYHSNFADNRGHIDHSARVMRVITWNRSFRGLTNTEDANDELDSEEHETHATVLDKMLAWEKKLYDEVKTGEQMKFEYQRKVASLNKLKERNASTETIEKTKSALSHLHTRYVVDMQSMDSTVSEINRLRDVQLYPRLVALVDGMAIMWENMKIEHQNQSKIVTALKFLDISQCPKETSGRHHEHTKQLWTIALEWHKQFGNLMNYQKEYIKALNGWLKLNLVPIDNNLKEKVSSPQRPQTPPIQSLLHAWHDLLQKLPDEQAKTAIRNFAAIIETILQFQGEEMELREKCEETRNDLKRKTQQYEDWHNKYMQRRTPADDIDPDRAYNKDLVAEHLIPVEVVRKKLQEEENDYNKQCTQVRQKSLNTLRTCLPELFKEMADFSIVCSDTYQRLRSISKPHKPSESS